MLNKFFSILTVLIFLFISSPLASAQNISPSPSINPSLTVNLSPTINPSIDPSPTATTSPMPTSKEIELKDKLIIEAIAACPSDQKEWISLKNLMQQTIHSYELQLIDAAGTEEIIEELVIAAQSSKKIFLQSIKLNNNGDTLSLKNKLGQLIDKIEYTSCKKDEIIYFQQQLSPSPITTPIPSPIENIKVTNTPTLETKKNNQQITNQTKSLKTRTLKLPILTISKNKAASTSSASAIVENILYKPLALDPLPIASVIIGGIILCLVGWFFIYLAKRPLVS